VESLTAFASVFSIVKMFLKFKNWLENKDFGASNLLFHAHTWLCHLVHHPTT
jgi:hypothetical protein